MMIVQAILRPCVSRLSRKDATIDKALQSIDDAVASLEGMKPLSLFEAKLKS